jgi:hypothetical protein
MEKSTRSTTHTMMVVRAIKAEKMVPKKAPAREHSPIITNPNVIAARKAAALEVRIFEIDGSESPHQLGVISRHR